MTRTDPDATGVYTAEDRLERWFELGAVTVFGSRWALEPEVRFGRVEHVQRYVDQVLQHLAVIGWGGGHPLPPVTVRRRAGPTKATYESERATIGIPHTSPTVTAGAVRGDWALRESVVLHELTHHLTHCGVYPPGSASAANAPTEPAHGPRFRATLLALFTCAGHPTASTLLRIAFTEEGLA